MPITKYDKKIDVPENDGLILVFNNGDKIAIEQVVKKWNFIDEASLLKFVIAIMLKAEGGKITIQAADGSQATLSPSDSLLKKQ